MTQYLLVGLGNPGLKYELNRHNAGFLILDYLADSNEAMPWKEKFKALYSKVNVNGNDILLLKPQTYMNLSGESLQKAMAFYKIPLSQVFVFHDELDLQFGDVRLKKGGGTAGHNGLKSIVKHCGGSDFNRIRFGIGRPQRGSVENYVLGDFPKEEIAELPDLFKKSIDLCLKAFN